MNKLMMVCDRILGQIVHAFLAVNGNKVCDRILYWADLIYNEWCMTEKQAQPMAELGKGIQKQRKALGLSQQQLAKFAGCAKLFILSVENGKETVRMDKLLAVLHVLGLQIKLQSGKDPIVVDRKILDAH